jgi:hypothetical protein
MPFLTESVAVLGGPFNFQKSNCIQNRLRAPAGLDFALDAAE